MGSTALNRSGTLLECLNRSQKMTSMPHIGCQLSHRGVFQAIKSLVHALGTGSSMTEPTINSTLLTFIEQVNIYDLQKKSHSLPYVLYPLWVIPIWFNTLWISAHFHYQIDVYSVKSCCVVYHGT